MGLQIDIEGIADEVRPKETVIKGLPVDSISEDMPPFLCKDEPLNKVIFQARDIKDLKKRKQYLEQIITTEKDYETKPQHISPAIKSVFINGKETAIPSDPIQREPDNKRIGQCENEIRIINDLLLLHQIVKERNEITETNEREYYLQHAKDGQTKDVCQSLQYYSASEFAKIIEIIKQRMQIKTPPENVNRLEWRGTQKDFSEMVKALSITALKGTRETDIVRLLGNMFTFSGKEFNEKRHNININELQDSKPRELFTDKMNKAVNDFLKNITNS